MVDSKLAEAFADRTRVAEVTVSEMDDLRVDANLGLAVAKGCEPIAEGVGLADIEHARP